MNFFKKRKWISLTASVASIVIGILLIIWPRELLAMICIVAGAVIATLGIIKVISYFTSGTSPLSADLALGIIATVIGIILIVRRNDAVAILPIIAGIIIILDSVFKFQSALDARRSGIPSWWSVLLLAIITAALGLLLVLNPFGSLNILMIMLGIALIVDGVQGLYTLIFISGKIKKLKKKSGSKTIYIKKD